MHDMETDVEKFMSSFFKEEPCIGMALNGKVTDYLGIRAQTFIESLVSLKMNE